MQAFGCTTVDLSSAAFHEFHPGRVDTSHHIGNQWVNSKCKPKEFPIERHPYSSSGSHDYLCLLASIVLLKSP